MNIPVDDIQKKPAQYWYIDGIVEITTGGIILLMALYLLAMAFIPSHWSALGVGIGLPILSVLCFLVANKISRAAKERLTYPRTGYVAYRRPTGSKRWLRFIPAMIFSAAVVGLVLWLPRINENWVMAGTGILVAIFMSVIGYRFSLPRFYLIGGAVFLAGLLITWLRLPDFFNIAALLAVMGVASLVSGAVTLRHYLHTTQPVSGDVP